jgi:hypothetical protein
MKLSEDVPGSRPLRAPYVRVQRSAKERRANRLEGLACRRITNQYEAQAQQVAAVARRQRAQKQETGVGPFEAGIVVEQRTHNVRTEETSR